MDCEYLCNEFSSIFILVSGHLMLFFKVQNIIICSKLVNFIFLKKKKKPKTDWKEVPKMKPKSGSKFDIWMSVCVVRGVVSEDLIF